MPNIQVDGIKKISRDELEKSRQAVLAAIAEEEKKSAEAGQPTAKEGKKIDGIIPKKISFRDKPAEKEMAVNFLASEKPAAVVSPPVLAPELPAVKMPAPAIAKKQVLPERILTADLRTEKLLEKKRQEEAALKKLREKQAEEAKKRELAKKQTEQKKQEEERQARLEKEKKEAAEKRLAQLKKEQQKARRQEAKNEFKAKFKNFLINFKSNFSHSLRVVFNLVVFGTVFFFLGYLIFALLLLRFNLDNGLARKIENRIAVPAIISEAGFISYYDYIQIYEQTKKEEQDIAVLKNNLAVRLLISGLISRYGLEGLNPDDPEDRNKISLRMLQDDAINQVAWQRILKIKKLIAAEGNFFEIASKFGDDVGKLDYASLNEAKQKFGESIGSLANEEVSDVILADKGYYVVKKNTTNENLFSYSYSFIKGKGLEEYLAENASVLKMWALLDVK